MRARNAALITMLAAGAVAWGLERDARACGGCFVPTETNTVVTDHRMILSIAKNQTTLYDQIRYQGSPESFAWVLPISGEVKVGLSADILFATLDSVSQTQVIQPPTRCPAPPSCQFGESANAPSAGGDAFDGVTVNKRETVGPYETVQLSATDPQALSAWLAKNGFTVPADVQPVVAKYVTEHFDFLALKLVPGAGVSSMRPVRVTTTGAAPVLPLRMVAAGTGPVVGITLWVVAEGRYEPQNFPSFIVSEDELVWDWSTQSSNYKALRASKTAASKGRAWEVESSQLLYPERIENLVRYGGNGGGVGPNGGDASQDYLPVAANGVVSKSADEVRREDLATLMGSIAGPEARLTRLRADLDHAALSEDLLLRAEATQSQLPTFRVPKGEANQPQCPVFQGCNQVGAKPRDEAIADLQAEKNAAAAQCNTTNAGSTGAGGGLAFSCAVGLGAVAVVMGSRRRRGAR